MAKKVAVYLILVFFTIMALFPVIWLVLTSFKSEVDVFSVPPKIFFKPTLKFYDYIFTTGYFPSYYKNSLIIGVLSTLISLFISIPAGYSLSRARSKARDVVSLAILAARMLPAVALVIPLYLLILRMGMLNSLFTIILMHTALNLPFSLWMLRSFFVSIPVELEEAAYIDGASLPRILMSIVVPLSLPGIFATGIFAFVQSWNEFIFALTLSATPRSQTLPVGISGYISARGVAWGELAASATLMIIPVLFFAAFMQKYMKKGILTGSIK